MQDRTSRSLVALYGELVQKMTSVYRFITLTSNYNKTPVDYGCGPKLALMEVHTLSMIGEYPGSTLTEIRDKFGSGHTLSAICQQVKKLLDKGLVYQKKNADNDKNKLLYLTEIGEQIHRAHIQSYAINANRMMLDLMETVSAEELDAFFKVVDAWSDLFMKYKQPAKGKPE